MGSPVSLSFTLGSSSTPGFGPSFNATVADNWLGIKVTIFFFLCAGASESNVAILRLYCLDAERSHRHVVNAELASLIGCDRAVTACFFGSRRCTYHVSAYGNAFEWVSMFIKHGTADYALGLRGIGSLWEGWQ
jgi:hypothetical protein